MFDRWRRKDNDLRERLVKDPIGRCIRRKGEAPIARLRLTQKDQNIGKGVRSLESPTDERCSSFMEQSKDV